MKTFLLIVLKNLWGMCRSWPFIRWGLRRLAKQSTNLIDDNFISLADAAHSGDVDGVKAALAAMQDEYNKIKRKK